MIRVVVSPALPMHPSPREDARRTVRHGFASAQLPGMVSSVLEWLGIDPGVKPGEPTHMMMAGDTLLVSAEHYARLKGAAVDGRAYVPLLPFPVVL